MGATEGHQYARTYTLSDRGPRERRTVDSRMDRPGPTSGDTARALAMDAVQKVGNGHPGTAMSLAPAAYLLYQRFLRHDPADPSWIGRDRFVLSNGHTSLTQYIQLFSGYGLNSATWRPSAPGAARLPGIRSTDTLWASRPRPVRSDRVTRRLWAWLWTRAMSVVCSTRSPRSVAARSITMCGSSQATAVCRRASPGEAASLAGHQKLGNLIVIYDDNHISIEGNTEVSFSEDVLARHAAYGWHTQHVDLGVDGDVDVQGWPAPCATPWTRPVVRRSSRCARSSPGPRPMRRTPDSPTDPRWRRRDRKDEVTDGHGPGC